MPKETKNIASEEPLYLGHRARLRTRFSVDEGKSMPDYELLELLLTISIPRRDVKPLAKTLITKFKNLDGVINASPEELLSIEGVSKNTVGLLKIVSAINLHAGGRKLRSRDNSDLSFAQELDVAQFHVFSYSERPGTAALRIPYVVDEQEKHHRSQCMIRLSEEKHRNFYQRFIGTERMVLTEHSHSRAKGFTDNYIRVEIPELDDRTEERDNHLFRVRLMRFNAEGDALTVLKRSRQTLKRLRSSWLTMDQTMNQYQCCIRNFPVCVSSNWDIIMVLPKAITKHWHSWNIPTAYCLTLMWR